MPIVIISIIVVTLLSFGYVLSRNKKNSHDIPGPRTAPTNGDVKWSDAARNHLTLSNAEVPSRLR